MLGAMMGHHLFLRAMTVFALATGVAAWLHPLDLSAAWRTDGDDVSVDIDAPVSLGLAGKILVAAPDLDDPYFADTRIYMLVADSDGAVGVVLNKHHLRPGLSEGGPVGQDEIVALVDDHAAPAGSLHVADGVAVLTDPHALDDEMVAAHARMFIGYAGWGPGQLDNELAHGVWRVVDGTAHDALDEAR
jgi:putative transcriptional regulator